MAPRTSLASGARQALLRPSSGQLTSRRCFAAAASNGSFETSDVAGLKVATRDAHGPTTTLAVVAKAGTRYQPLPGLTAGLEAFAFKNTQRRSALRINRESELLGGQLAASHTREALVLQASFLREDLPYFAELLAEVVSMTRYTTHEFHEEVDYTLQLKQTAVNQDVTALALDNAHAVAFHNGLGSPLYPTPSAPSQKYLNEEYVASFADVVYSKPNIAVVADGASPDSISKWIGQFFKDVPTTPQSGQTLDTTPSKYYGGEQRLNHTAGNSMVLAFPGSGYKNGSPEMAVLAALIGGQSTIKWTSGYSILSKATSDLTDLSASSTNISYSDAGLLTIQLSGSAASVRKGAHEAAKGLRAIADGSISKEDVAKAVANAKFVALDAVSLRGPNILLTGSGLVNSGEPVDLSSLASSLDTVTADKLQKAAKTLIEGKATVSTVGDLFVLPFAEDIGLRV